MFGKYNQNDQVKEDEIGITRSGMGQKTNAFRILLLKPDGQRPLGRARCWWAYNIKMTLNEIGCNGLG
jgi:hypothetical protein